MKTEYLKQAENFLNKTGTELSVKYLKTDKYFYDDKEKRDIYEVTLKRGSRSYTFTFGQSTFNSRYNVGTKVFHRDEIENCLEKDGKINRFKFSSKHFRIESFDKIIYPKIPDAYDILACMEKYDVGSFEDFCNEFGYDTDSRNAEKIYNSVKEQYTKLQTLFNQEEIEELAEIN